MPGHRGTVATLLVMACLGCLSAGGERIGTERDLLRRIQASGTYQDHEALAALYRERGQEMKDKAAFHARQAKRYAWTRGGVRLGRVRSRARATWHRERAVEYDALATLHEGHARELREPSK